MDITQSAENKMWRGRLFRYAPLVLWIGVVLFASTGNASMSQTSRFVRPLLEFLFPNTPEETLVIYHAYIRKLAHLTEYAILGFFASRAFVSSGQTLLRKYWYVFAFLVVILIAAIDETNQSFLASRTGSIYDVMLDATGGALMIFALMLYFGVRKTKNNS